MAWVMENMEIIYLFLITIGWGLFSVIVGLIAAVWVTKALTPDQPFVKIDPIIDLED